MVAAEGATPVIAQAPDRRVPSLSTHVEYSACAGKPNHSGETGCNDAGAEGIRSLAAEYAAANDATIARIPRTCPPDLYIGWCRSDPRNADGAQSD